MEFSFLKDKFCWKDEIIFVNILVNIKKSRLWNENNFFLLLLNLYKINTNKNNDVFLKKNIGKKTLITNSGRLILFFFIY